MRISLTLYIFHTVTSLITVNQENINQPLLLEKQNSQKVLNRLKRETDGSVPNFISEHELIANDQNQALIHWTEKTIFILTRKKQQTEVLKSEFWRSTDYGSKWEKEDYKFNLPDTTDQNVIKSFTISPLDSNRVVFLESKLSPNGGGIIWASKNSGHNFSHHALPSGVVIDDVTFHPAKADWMLGYDRLQRNLYISTDFAANWQLLDTGVSPSRYFWYIPGTDTNEMGRFQGEDEFGAIDVERLVHFERNTTQNGIQLFEMKSCLIPKCVLANGAYAVLMSNSKQVKLAENTLTIRDDFIFFEKAKGALNKLYVSYKRGTFKEAEFPPEVGQINYHVVSSDQGFVMLAVNHEHGISQLFSSTNNGTKYRKVLNNVRYFERKQNNLLADTAYAADVHDVKGIVGCFIANQHIISSYVPIKSTNQTMITWDAGKTWSRLSKPLEKNSNGDWVEDERFGEGYHLNLHLEKTETSTGYHVPSITTKESYPGYIIAHGSVGLTLEDSPTQFNLYVSTDAGKTWRSTLSGRYVVAVSDSGAITTALPMTPTMQHNKLEFSSTEGNKWKKIQFSDGPVTVDAVLTEPGELTKFVTIFGHSHYTQPWRIWTVNFTSLHQDCNQSSDYEMWKYAECNNNNVLGMNVAIRRRKENVECFNGETFKRTFENSSCSDCRLDDYFCQEGWSVHEDNSCVKDTRASAPDSDWIPKMNFRPIKAPGNQCLKEYDWPDNGGSDAPSNYPKPKEIFIAEINGIKSVSNRFTFEIGTKILLRFGSESDIQKSPGRWSVFFPKNIPDVYKRQFSLIEFSHLDKHNSSIEFNLVYPGIYTINYDNGKESDSLILKAWIAVKRTKLYCPPYSQVNHKNEFIVRVSSKDDDWLRPDWEKYNFYGDMSHHWYGDLPDSATYSNGDAYNISFSKNDIPTIPVHKTIVVDTDSSSSGLPNQFKNELTSKCTTTFQKNVQILSLKITNSSFKASNDDYMQGFNQIVAKSIHSIDSIKKAIIDPEDSAKNIVHLEVFTVPDIFINTIYLYIIPLKPTETESKLKEISKQVGLALLEDSTFSLETRDRKMPHPLKSVYYVSDDGEEIDIKEGGVAGKVFGWIIFILILIPACYFGGRFLYRKHQTHRYAHPLSAPRDDTQAIIEQEYIDDGTSA